MSANNYKDYIELLRSREARPSFEQTKAILEARENETMGLLASGSTARKFAIGIAGLMLIALTAKMYVYDSQTQPIAAKSVPVARSISQSSEIVTKSEKPTSISSLRGVPEGRSSGIGGSNSLRASRISVDRHRSVDRQRSMDRPVITSRLLAMPNDVNHASGNLSKDGSVSNNNLSDQPLGYVPVRLMKIKCRSQNNIPTALSMITIPGAEDNSANRFYVTLGGSFAHALNSPTSVSRSSLDDCFGVGYNISSQISIGISGSMENFVINKPTYSIGFTDASFVHNGIPTQNIIGHINTILQPQSTLINSFGANLRYAFGDGFSPYAELFGGGSSEGVIGGLTVGVSIYRFDELSLDAGAFIRSLFPTGSATDTKLGGSLQLRYNW
jgi:hypothetical protein